MRGSSLAVLLCSCLGGLPPSSPHSSRRHQKDEGISSRTLKDQWKGLVLQPLSQLEAGSVHSPLLIMIDALDECEKESDLRLVLHLLSDSRRLGRLRFRVFITS